MAKLTKKSSIIELEDELMEMQNDEIEELAFDDEDDDFEFDFEEDMLEDGDEEEEEDEDTLEIDEDDEDTLEIEEDEEEEVEVITPVKKSKPVKKEVKEVSTKQVKKSENPKAAVKKEKEKTVVKTSGKKRNPIKVKEKATYEGLMKQVHQKVENYDRIMTERAYGKSTAMPHSTAISKDLFVKLLVAKATESNDNGMKLAMKKAMVSMGFDREDVEDALSSYSFKETEMLEVYTQMFDLMYDILSAGSGFPLFKDEDCNATLEGRWTDETIRLNEHLNTKYVTRIESFLKITTKSTAPASKKQKGHMKGNKFVPVKE